MQCLFFTDLDGTLLDHETYDYSPALPALNALKEHGIPLILASSKTGAEITAIRSSLELNHCPAIVENGSGELSPDDTSSSDNSQYLRLREILDKLPTSLRKQYTGFGDVSFRELATLTGLSVKSAQLAQQRSFTEPGLFDGNESAKLRFIDKLAEYGVSARDGGRFLTLSFGRTKADGVLAIAKRLGAEITVALGDAPNDRDMLLAATHAVIIRNDHAPDIGTISGAIRTKQSGPAGWNTAVLEMLEKLKV